MRREPEAAGGFLSFASVFVEDPFADLLASVRLEPLGRGRQGGVLLRVDEVSRVPIVRTTTRYGAPAQRLPAAHERLARRIEEVASLPIGFNNALIERYTNDYASMGAHSDQALDLAEGSFIALFSCYERQEAAPPPRKLVVEAKAPGGDVFEIPLAHNGAVVFSTDTNRRFRHRIVLDRAVRAPENPWLGITLRTSRTLLRFRGGHPYLPGDIRLTLADEEQRRAFYRLRHRENTEADFTYPTIAYTLSESDLMPPEG